MKKNLMTVLILALLIVNIILTSIMMFSVMNTNKKTAELVTNIATAMNLELTVPGEEAPKEEISLADTAVYNLTESLTIPLKSEGDKVVYIVFDVALSMNTKHDDYKTYGETIADRESLIEDAITSVLRNHTESECRDDFEKIKAEILTAVQDFFKSDFIYDVATSNEKFG